MCPNCEASVGFSEEATAGAHAWYGLCRQCRELPHVVKARAFRAGCITAAKGLGATTLFVGLFAKEPWSFGLGVLVMATGMFAPYWHQTTKPPRA